jgi:hypothetical protein
VRIFQDCGSSLFSVELQSDGEKKSSSGVEFSLAPSEGERAGVRGQTVITKPVTKLYWDTQKSVRESSPSPRLSPHPQSLSPSEGAREGGVPASIQSVTPPKIEKNLATGIKLLGISSVDCIAAQAAADGVRGKFSVAIDALRGEFYLASYETSGGSATETIPLKLAPLAEAQERERAGELLIGPEVTRWFPNGRIIFPQAAMLARLAARRSDFVAGEKIEPIYLRETTFVKAPASRAIPL